MALFLHFVQATQRLSGWRHSVASTAAVLLDSHFADKDNIIESIDETCDRLQRNRAFAYEGLPGCTINLVDEGSESITEEKAFRSSFILQLLAHAHLCACSGSISVPALNLSVKEYQARGAIALCASAVSRFSITDF